MSPLTDQQKAEILKAVAQCNGNKTHAARMVGCHRQTIIDVCKEAGQFDEKCQKVDSLGVVEKGDSCEVSYLSDRQIRTLEDAIAYGKVDTSVWCVVEWKCGGWNVPLKLHVGFDDKGQRKPEQPITKQMWKVSLTLRRILPKPYIDASSILFERIQKHAPKYPAPSIRTKARDHMLVFDPYDVHFGKLAWAPETGSSYNIDHARKALVEAARKFVSMGTVYPLEQVVIAVGQDFFHVDKPDNTTTAGTPQDVDSRFTKIIVAGEEAMIEVVELFQKVADVKLLYVPGNHDRIASFHLIRTLNAWFRNASNVTVDFEPTSRKYVKYGSNLIGYTHGNEERHVDLPIIMATERPQDFADATCREWHLGHLHKSRRTVTTNVDTYNGVVVRILMSLSGTDAWHHRKGYVGGTRAAEALVYHKKYGLEASLVARAS
jgi:hypothetical protein